MENQSVKLTLVQAKKEAMNRSIPSPNLSQMRNPAKMPYVSFREFDRLQSSRPDKSVRPLTMVEKEVPESQSLKIELTRCR